MKLPGHRGNLLSLGLGPLVDPVLTGTCGALSHRRRRGPQRPLLAGRAQPPASALPPSRGEGWEAQPEPRGRVLTAKGVCMVTPSLLGRTEGPRSQNPVLARRGPTAAPMASVRQGQLRHPCLPPGGDGTASSKAVNPRSGGPLSSPPSNSRHARPSGVCHVSVTRYVWKESEESRRPCASSTDRHNLRRVRQLPLPA